MSVQYCHSCDEYVDTDYNAEHFDNEVCQDEPRPKRQYALTGGPDDKCISNGSTWAESIIKS